MGNSFFLPPSPSFLAFTVSACAWDVGEDFSLGSKTCDAGKSFVVLIMSFVSGENIVMEIVWDWIGLGEQIMEQIVCIDVDSI